jgi:hypothetical protein
VDLCKNTLDFLKLLLETELIRIDFVVSRSGLVQVLINLLKFYSENLAHHSTTVTGERKPGLNGKKEPAVLTSLKNLFTLVCRLLLKLNENQDADLFSYFANCLINLCYNSNSNVDFHSLNITVKEIFLKIANSVISDLNFIYTNTSDHAAVANSHSSSATGNSVASTVTSTLSKPTALFKKFMNPLLSSNTTPSNKHHHHHHHDVSGNSQHQQSQQDSNESASSSPASLLASGLFDSEVVFQKFITFLVDFIHIVFDKISDSPLDDAQYDVNDELSISGFTVLTECLVISLENNQRAKFTSLFRNNLNLIRYQV